MIGFNGGLLGVRKVPTTGSASGLWVPNEQSVAKRAGIWPSTPATDPNFANVSLLLHADGTNGSTSFTDFSSNAHTITVYGDAQVTTTSPKFGTGALLLDGTGDCLSAPSHTSLTFGTGDLTIEAWVRFDTISATQYIFSQRDTSGISLNLFWDGTGARLNIFYPSGNTTTEPSYLIAADTYYHLAVTRSGTTFKMWVNGVERASSTRIEDALSGTSIIGARDSSGTTPLDGRIDDLRITKGVARYTATFTPPTAAFPDA